MATPLRVTYAARHCAVLFVFVFSLSAPATTSAGDRFWINSVAGSFDDPGNWSLSSGGPRGASVPVVGDSAIFDQPETYDVTLNADASLDELDIDAGTITFDSSGGPHTYRLLTGPADAVIAGANVVLDATSFNLGDDLTVNNGTMLVTGGGDVTAADRVSIATSTGDAEVTFDNASFDFGGVVRLALSGLDGTLNLRNSSTGNVGGDLDFVRSGTLGSGGWLNVESGSTLTANGRVLVGDILSGAPPDPLTDYNAFITVDGTNAPVGETSTFTIDGANILRVGDSAFDNVNAELIVRNGGVFNSGTGTNATIVQRTGVMTLESVGTFNARGDLLVTQTGEINASSSALLDAQQLFSIQSGGSVAISNAADLTATDIEVGVGNGDSSTSTLSLLGFSSTITQSGSSTLQIGGAGTESGTVLLNGSVNFTTGTGAVTIGDTGTLDIQLGTFNANGNLVLSSGANISLDGGNLNANAGFDNSAGGTLDMPDGKLTVTGGALVPSGGSFVVEGGGGFGDQPHLELGAGATANLTGTLGAGSFEQGELSITSGAAITSDRGLFGAASGGLGIGSVDGAGSTWIVTQDLIVGGNGAGNLTISNGAHVDNSGGYIGFNTSGEDNSVTVTGAGSTWTSAALLVVGQGSNGTLSVTAGAQVSSGGEIHIADFINSNSLAAVDGAGSTLSAVGDVYVGGDDNADGGTGELRATNDGLVTIGGTLTNWSKGKVTLDGGTITADAIDNTHGGEIDFQSGVLTIHTGIGIGSSTPFPGSFSASLDRHLVTTGTTTVEAATTLALNGGSLTTNGLAVNGTFHFNSGVLELTGGTVTGLLQLVVPTNGTLRAAGTYDATTVAAGFGSRITATGAVTLGDASQTNGFYSNGAVDVADQTVTLLDANDAVFDSGAAVDLGDTGAGTMNAAGGLTLDFGGNIGGFGTIDTPDNPATPVTNNGNITGNSLAEPVTLTGYVQGVGTCDNCNITGTDAPGFSPATVIRGSVAYNGVLEIELAGVGLGQFDRIEHILGSGIADLGGTLDVSLLGGFTPDVGDTFEIITAADVQDMFAIENFPVVAGLDWNVVYGATNVVLEVVSAVDLDGDDDIDGRDFLLVQANTPALIPIWEEQYGTSIATLPAAQTAPEPSSWICLLTTAAFIRGRRVFYACDRRVLLGV